MNYFKSLSTAALFAGLCVPASAAFVINELDSDTPGTDRLEFLELKGTPGESADGLTLVFYDGGTATVPGPKVLSAVDLDGLKADANGFILLADQNLANTVPADMVMPDAFLQNGEDAVVLYNGNAVDYPVGSAPTIANAIDIIVYEANLQADQNWSSLGSPTKYNEGLHGLVAERSLARIPDGSSGTWVPSDPSPDAPNLHYTVTTPNFVRMNQATASVPTTQSVTIENVAGVPLTITSFDLATTSSAAFSIVQTADPAVPVTLQIDQSTSVVVQFLETNVSVNKSYLGAVNFTTDSPTTPTGSVGFATQLVRGTAASVGSVMVNELSYNPGTEDHNKDGNTINQSDEFVELVNMTASPILIEGWEQRCKDNDTPTFHSFVFPLGATIPANGFVTVFTGGNPTGFIPGTTFTYGAPRIRNSGAYVGISDATKLIDGVAFLAAQDPVDLDGYTNMNVSVGGGGSIGRRPDGSATFRAFSATDTILTDRPTPNLTNNEPSSRVNEWSLF